MAKPTINVTVYVDWDNRRIFTKDDLDDYRDELAEEAKCGDAFECWLDENYCASQIWGKQDEINDAWDEYIEDEVGETIDSLDEIELMCYPHEYEVEHPF